MAARSDYSANALTFFDDQTQERVLPVRPIVFKEDFLGAGWAGTIPTAVTFGSDWIKKIVHTSGTPAVAGVANGVDGIVQLALDSTSEKQEASLYFGDQKTFNSLADLHFEARVAFPVLPTLLAVAVFGVHANWIDGPEAGAEYAHFKLDATGGLSCETQDGTTQLSVASGLSIATTTEEHILRVEFPLSGGVKFYVDGNIVAESQTFPWAATGTAAVLQPYLSVYKASGAGVATVNVDFVRLWGNR